LADTSLPSGSVQYAKIPSDEGLFARISEVAIGNATTPTKNCLLFILKAIDKSHDKTNNKSNYC
jgi:hypothetical protein